MRPLLFGHDPNAPVPTPPLASVLWTVALLCVALMLGTGAVIGWLAQDIDPCDAFYAVPCDGPHPWTLHAGQPEDGPHQAMTAGPAPSSTAAHAADATTTAAHATNRSNP
jgi:hypothetical protein